MKPLNKKNNFSYLFFSLIIFLFSASVMVNFSESIGEDIFSILAMIMFIVSLKSLNTERTWKWSLYTLIIFFVLFTTLEKIFAYHIYVYLVLLTLLVFFIGSFMASVKQILFIGDVDRNKIIGSLTLYILLGLIWTIIYLLLLAIDPKAFSGIETVTNLKQIFSLMAYYSFITLTTVGYGDITPANHVAQFFAYMEAIAGVFYMAIVVSSLISLRLSAMQNEKKGK